MWQDRRTADACAQYRARGFGEIVFAKTGLVLDPYFSATKIASLLDHVAGLRARAEAGEIAFSTVDSWLVWKLTGGARHVTDMTSASRTMLFDIPRAILPEVLPCIADFGTTAPGMFATTIPITGVAKNTYGRGSFVLLNTGHRVVTSGHGLISTLAFAFERTKATYALEGSITITGAAVQWLRDGLAFVERSSEIEALAATVDDNGGVYFLPAFSGLAAPNWDPYAHIARAALEAMAVRRRTISRCNFKPICSAGPSLAAAPSKPRHSVVPMRRDCRAASGRVSTRCARIGEKTAVSSRNATMHRWHDAVARSRGWAAPLASE